MPEDSDSEIPRNSYNLSRSDDFKEVSAQDSTWGSQSFTHSRKSSTCEDIDIT